MKYILTILAVMVAFFGKSQTKVDSSKQQLLNIGLFTPKPDTIKCYFLKVTGVVKSPLQPIATQWYLGYMVEHVEIGFIPEFIYIDKSPVKEHVLISIPLR